MVVAALATADAPLAAIFAFLLASGLGIGSSTNAGLTLLRALSDSQEIGRATSAHQFYRNLGFTLGAAAGGAVILVVVGSAVGDVEAVRNLLAGTDVAATADVESALADGFAVAATVGAAVAATAIVPFLVLRRHLAPARAMAGR